MFKMPKIQYLRKRKKTASANLPRNEVLGLFANLFHFCKKDLILKQKTLQSRLSNPAPSPRLVVGRVHLQISFIVLFVPLLQKSPQKKPFHLQTELRLRCFIPFLQIDRFNFHRFANFGKLKNFFLLQI